MGDETKAPRRRMTREESRQQTRQRLLESAAQLFAERGVLGTSVDDITERAGYTRGAFYANYESKTALFFDLLTRRLDADLERVQQRFEAAAPGERPALLAQWLAHGRDDLDYLLTVEHVRLAQHDPELRAALARYNEALRGRATRIVEEHFAELGAPPQLPPAEIAMALLALTDGLSLQRLMEPGTVAVELTTRLVQQLLQPAS